jgi:hypothetical protein
VGFEPTIAVFERAKTFHALDRVANVIGTDRFTPGEKAPDNPWIGRWVGLRADLDAVEKRKLLSLPLSYHYPYFFVV